MKNFCRHENAKNDLKRCQDHAKATGGNIHEEILISIKIPQTNKKNLRNQKGAKYLLELWLIWNQQQLYLQPSFNTFLVINFKSHTTIIKPKQMPKNSHALTQLSK